MTTFEGAGYPGDLKHISIVVASFLTIIQYCVVFRIFDTWESGKIYDDVPRNKLMFISLLIPLLPVVIFIFIWMWFIIKMIIKMMYSIYKNS